MVVLRRRFWVEVGFGTVSILLLILTLLSREWIEVAFGVDPDNGSGTAEWLIVGATALVALLAFAMARVEWLRTRPATG